MSRLPRNLSHTQALGAIAALTLSTVSIGAVAADPMTSATGGKVPSADRKFIEKAAIGGMTEVQMGKLAQEKGTRKEVKDFGARMVTDHTKANEELQKVASAKGITVPGAIDKSHRKDIDKLAKKSGARIVFPSRSIYSPAPLLTGLRN